MKSIECSGESLLVGRVGQHISRQLPGNELVVRHILVDGGNDPIAVEPPIEITVRLVSRWFGIASHVEPTKGGPFSELGCSQQAVYVRFISPRVFGLVQKLHIGGFGQAIGKRQTRPPRKNC